VIWRFMAYSSWLLQSSASHTRLGVWCNGRRQERKAVSYYHKVRIKLINPI